MIGTFRFRAWGTVINYYEHHIGDYAAATAHLSLIEDAIYSRMLRRYYLQEVPLPADVSQVARLVGARGADEVEAVRVVLGEFFVLADDGWHNKRADQEIARYQEKCGKAAKSAAARWGDKKPPTAKPPHSGRNANALPTHTEGNAHQAPDTKHQDALGKSSGDGNLEVSAQPADRPTVTPGAQACIAMRAAGIPAERLNPQHAELLAALEAGATPEEFGATAAELIASGKPPHLTYVVRAVMGRRTEAKARASPLQTGRPSVTDSFANRTYTGTPDDELPEHLRPAA